MTHTANERPTLVSILQWLAFPLVVAWIIVFYLPWRVARWAILGETGSQRAYRQKRWAQQQADWQSIEAAMQQELQARKWPDTPRYRSILLSGRWPGGRK